MIASIDKLGLGTAQFGLDHGLSNLRGRMSETEAKATLGLAADHGVQLLDTSAAFGAAEEVIGRAMPRTRPFRIVTRTIAVDAGLSNVEAQARRSLRALGVPKAYALLVGGAEDLTGPHGDELWKMVQGLKGEGLFEKVGVSATSNDSPAALARRFKPDIVQVPVSLLDQRLVQSGDLERLADQGVEVHLRSIFMQGLLFLPRDGLPPALTDAGPRLSRIRREIAEAGADPLQAALAFALQRPEAQSVIVGVASAAELRAIIAAATAPSPDLDWANLSLDPGSVHGAGLWAAA